MAMRFDPSTGRFVDDASGPQGTPWTPPSPMGTPASMSPYGGRWGDQRKTAYDTNFATYKDRLGEAYGGDYYRPPTYATDPVKTDPLDPPTWGPDGRPSGTTEDKFGRPYAYGGDYYRPPTYATDPVKTDPVELPMHPPTWPPVEGGLPPMHPPTWPPVEGGSPTFVDPANPPSNIRLRPRFGTVQSLLGPGQ